MVQVSYVEKTVVIINSCIFLIGNISTIESLDREEKAVYEVSVEVHDSGTPPRHSKATVRVLVTDVNDNTPRFMEHLYRVTVPPRQPTRRREQVARVSLV